MRNLTIFILLISLSFACNKQKIEVPQKQLPSLENDVVEQPAWRKPSVALTYEKISATQVKLKWTGVSGNQTSTVYKNGAILTTCTRCKELIVDLPQVGRDQYKVNGSNTVTVEAFQEPPTNGEVKKYIRLEFNGGVVSNSGWNYFGDLIMTPSGLEQWQQDSVLFHVKRAFAKFNIIIVTEGPADQVCYITDYNEWFGTQAGGVAFVNSFYTGDPCYAFAKLLLHIWQHIAFVVAHELGHTLGLMHTCEKYGNKNWLNYDYQESLWEKMFSDSIMTVTINNICELWNQLLIILTTLSK